MDAGCNDSQAEGMATCAGCLLPVLTQSSGCCMSTEWQEAAGGCNLSGKLCTDGYPGTPERFRRAEEGSLPCGKTLGSVLS